MRNRSVSVAAVKERKVAHAVEGHYEQPELGADESELLALCVLEPTRQLRSMRARATHVTRAGRTLGPHTRAPGCTAR